MELARSGLLINWRKRCCVQGIYFYITDHLGTVRAILDVDGNIKSTHDYEPFGVELQPLSDETTNFKYKYTGQERDNKTNLDYMHFRYYASAMGRFLKPDNIISNPANPQSWNLYSYVNGNPVNFNDPTGHAMDSRPQFAYMQGTHSFGMTWFDQFSWHSPNWTPWAGQTADNSWYFGATRSAMGYYAEQYLSSQSIGGTLNAGHEAFNDWVLDLMGKGLNLDVETLYYLKAIYQMSKNSGVELAFYISPTKDNGLAIIVIFGSESSVNSNVTSSEKKIFTTQLSFDWNSFFFYGHTHPQESGKSGLGVSTIDVDIYCRINLQNPWAMGLIIQQKRDDSLCLMYVGFLPTGPFRISWVAP